jgi:hypothetical protein
VKSEWRRIWSTGEGRDVKEHFRELASMVRHQNRLFQVTRQSRSAPARIKVVVYGWEDGKVKISDGARRLLHEEMWSIFSRPSSRVISREWLGGCRNISSHRDRQHWMFNWGKLSSMSGQLLLPYNELLPHGSVELTQLPYLFDSAVAKCYKAYNLAK